jgi:hypothetical protein
LAKALIEYGKERKRPGLVRDMTDFIATGELPVISLRAAIMRTPRFLGRTVAPLRRGNKVRVLDTKGSWLRVEFKGKEGWLHRNRLFPPIIRLRSGATGSGTTRGEAETGRRG